MSGITIFAAEKIVIGVLIIGASLLLIRNAKVAEYRLTLIDKIHDLNVAEIDTRPYDTWRYSEFNKVTYEQMLYHFWKPLTAFYKDKSFLREREPLSKSKAKKFQAVRQGKTS